MKVIKKVLLPVFLLLFFLNSYSQKAIYKINGGLNLTNFKYSISINGDAFSYTNNIRKSYFIGVGIEKSIDLINSINFLINAELQYSQQGNSFHSAYIGTQLDINNQINLLLSVKPEIFKNVFLGVGSYFGYLVYVDEYYREDEGTHKSLDLGILGSVEYKFLQNLSFEIKYLYGLSDILNREFESGSITHDKFNKVIQIGLNYKF
jgi:hypothetical protein